MFKGQSVPFEVRHEVVKVAGGADVAIDVRSTGHGPVISDVSDRLKAVGGVYALRWTATTEPDRILDAFLGINTGERLDLVPRRARPVRGAVPELRLRRHRRPHRAPAARPHPDPPGPHGPGRPAGPGLDRDARVDRLHRRTTSCPACSTRPSGHHRDGQRRRGRFEVPALHRPGVGPRLPGGPDHGAPRGGRGQGRRDARRDERHPDGHVRARGPSSSSTGSATSCRRPTTDARCWPGSARGTGAATWTASGCAAYMTFEYHVLRGLFDPRLGLDIARDYVGQHGQLAGSDRPARPTRRARGGTTRPRRRPRPRSSVVVAALDARGEGPADDVRRPGPLDVGSRAHDHVRGGDPRRRAGLPVVTWYFNAGPFPVAGASGAVDNTYSHLSVGVPRPAGRPYEAGRLREVFDVTNGPSYRLDDRHGRPRRGHDRHHDRPVGQPVRPPHGDMIPPG